MKKILETRKPKIKKNKTGPKKHISNSNTNIKIE